MTNFCHAVKNPDKINEMVKGLNEYDVFDQFCKRPTFILQDNNKIHSMATIHVENVLPADFSFVCSLAWSFLHGFERGVES